MNGSFFKISDTPHRPPAQDMFNRVVTHLRKQARRSVREGSRASLTGSGCLYRGPDGTMCAVGCLIADEHYDGSLEGESVTSTNTRRALERSLGYELTGWELRLLGDLQLAHDRFPPAEWETEFACIAARYDLIVPPRHSPAAAPDTLHEVR